MLADTGIGDDLISPNDVPQWLLDEAIPLESLVVLQTANGPVALEKRVRLQCPGLPTNLAALLLDDTPPVVSLGLRVEEEFYDFHWIHGHNPYFVSPDGGVVWLEVEHHVPWINNNPGVTAAGNDAVLPIVFCLSISDKQNTFFASVLLPQLAQERLLMTPTRYWSTMAQHG